MKNIIALVVIGLTLQLSAEAQTRLLDRAGKVRFYSEAPVENIEATTNQALGVLDTMTNKVAVSILMKGFHFEKALMEEHFNENYVESDKYPKATFTGTIMDEVDLGQPGTVEAKVQGEMTIHGVTNPVEAVIKFVITEEKMTATTTFMIKVADYKIKIPTVVVNNIAEEVEVTANFNF